MKHPTVRKSHCPHQHRDARNITRSLAIFAMAALPLGGFGCRGSFRDRKYVRLLTQRDIRAYVTQIREGPLPDTRRHAINRLAETPHVNDPDVLLALDAAATNDASDSVRTAAVLALGRSNAPACCRTCLAVLDTPPAPPGRQDPAAGARAGAVQNLHACASRGGIPEGLRAAVAQIACRLLRQDPDRNVRVGAARILGYFPQRDVLDALVGALEQRDFGVCYEAERSLMRQTGHTFNYDPRAWRAFLGQSSDPWADRGALDNQLDPPKRKWYQLRVKKE